MYSHKGNLKHGMSKTRFYNTWSGMKRRCLNKKDAGYANYGGRGIRICDRWLKFENFRDDMHESYVEHAEKHGEKDTFIERIDNNGNYEPENCGWATRVEQNDNTRQVKHYLYEGEMLNLAEIARRIGINYRTLRNRIFVDGWTLDQAIEKSQNRWAKKDSKLYKYKGKMKTLTEIAREEGIRKETLFGRIKEQKMTLSEALNIPKPKKFKAINLKTGEVTIESSQAEFARRAGLRNSRHISKVLKGDRKTTCGYTFEYID